MQQRLKTAASTAASRRQSGRLRRGGDNISETEHSGGAGQGMMISSRNFTEETHSDGLLKHPSTSCIFHLLLIGCSVMADTPAEMNGYGSDERCDRRQGYRLRNVYSGCKRINEALVFIPHIYCKIIMQVVEPALQSNAMNSGVSLLPF